MNRPFWDVRDSDCDPELTQSAPSRKMFVQLALERGQTLHKLNFSNRKCNKAFEEKLLAFLEGLGGIVSMKARTHCEDGSSFKYNQFVYWPDSCLDFNVGDSDPKDYEKVKRPFSNIDLELLSLDKTLIDAVEAFVLKNTQKMPKEKKYPAQVGNFINALLRTPMEGLKVHKIGYVSAPVELHNYTAEVREGYKHIIKDLRDDIPTGKISILDGPPGTGKTYLVRGIITEMRGFNFLLVPPDLLEAFGKPDMLPFLLDYMENMDTDENGKRQPLVLVMEDADAMLSKRQASSMNAIASALNLGDGILGDALNIRILTTTNSPIDELDPAMLRDGRLSVRISMGELDVETANHILDRLKAPHTDIPLTLAQVYGRAKKQKNLKLEIAA